MAWGGTGRRGWPIPDTVSFKVKVSATDTTESWLWDALAAGPGIALAILNPGADESIQISSNYVVGPGTVNTHAMFTGVNTVGDSQTSESGGWTRINDTVIINSAINPTPASGNPRLWVRSNNVGYSPNISGNDLVLESTVEPGMTFLTVAGKAGYQYYQAAAAAPTVRFGYDFADSKFKWKISASDAMQLNAAIGLIVYPTVEKTGFHLDGNTAGIGNPQVMIRSDGASGSNARRGSIGWYDGGDANPTWEISRDMFNNALQIYREPDGGASKRLFFQCHNNQSFFGADRGDDTICFQLPVMGNTAQAAITTQVGFLIYNTSSQTLKYVKNDGTWLTLTGV